MRQWMVDPKILCKKHLLGEHLEHHMYYGVISRKCKVDGYIKRNLLEPMSLKFRHDYLVLEMIRRGYSHYSDFPELTRKDLEYMGYDNYSYQIDVIESLDELLSRCDICKENYRRLKFPEYNLKSASRLVKSTDPITMTNILNKNGLFDDRVYQYEVFDCDYIKLYTGKDEPIILNVNTIAEMHKDVNIVMKDGLYCIIKDNTAYISKDAICCYLSLLIDVERDEIIRRVVDGEFDNQEVDMS